VLLSAPVALNLIGGFMKMFAMIAVSLFAVQAFAGTGGFTTVTCVSKSGRTVVTTNESDTDPANIMVSIDGIAKIYNNKDKGTSADAIEGGIEGYQDGKGEVILMEGGKNRTLIVSKDPRVGTQLNHMSKDGEQRIPVSCRTFTQEP
jgi:hypothetical protein